MGNRASFGSGRGGVVALASALALSSACGRTGLLTGHDTEAGGDGGRSGVGGGSSGRGFGGAAGSRRVEPLGGAGSGGASGSAGAQTGGAAGGGGQQQQSVYCGAGKRAVLYLLAQDEVILRVDADTLETLTRVRVDAPELFSLAATDTGVVYATSVLELYRIDPLSGDSVNVVLSDSVFESNGALSVGFSPADPVLFGDTLLLAQVVSGKGVDLYATPLGFGVLPLWRHRFDGMTETPELVVAPDGRTFALFSEGFVEYDPGILSQLAALAVPGLKGRSGDAAYLAGYLFAVYPVNQRLSRLYRAHVMPDLEDSPIEEVGPIADFIIGSGAACEALP